MGYRPIMQCSVIAWLTFSAGGCSFVFVSGPPLGHEELEYFTCTESNSVPVLDVLWAGLNASSLAAGASSSPSGAVVGVSLGWVALSGFSAWTGFKRVNECRAARIELARRTAPAVDSRAVAGDQVRWPAPPRPAVLEPGGIRN